MCRNHRRFLAKERGGIKNKWNVSRLLQFPSSLAVNKRDLWPDDVIVHEVKETQTWSIFNLSLPMTRSLITGTEAGDLLAAVSWIIHFELNFTHFTLWSPQCWGADFWAHSTAPATTLVLAGPMAHQTDPNQMRAQTQKWRLHHLPSAGWMFFSTTRRADRGCRYLTAISLFLQRKIHWLGGVKYTDSIQLCLRRRRD